MIRYRIEFDDYFVNHFRNSSKFQSRSVPSRHRPDRAVSVVTTCMNRLDDLRLTLPKNISDNHDYPSEFVLVDYDSKDGLGDWVKSDMMPYIMSGKLIYYKVLDQPYFRPNHSRNVSFRLSRHEIITNVDSDNYMHQGFLKRINQCVDENVIALPQSFLSPGSDRLSLRGRFAITSRDLIKLGGFDEELDQWGYSHDDVSFVLRAMIGGFKTSRFEDKFLLGRIETPPSDRVKFTMRGNYDASRSNNARVTADKISRGVVAVNRGKPWGEATVIKNFEEVITLEGVPTI